MPTATPLTPGKPPSVCTNRLLPKLNSMYVKYHVGIVRREGFARNTGEPVSRILAPSGSESPGNEVRSSKFGNSAR